jgi:hypothetical protein
LIVPIERAQIILKMFHIFNILKWISPTISRSRAQLCETPPSQDLPLGHANDAAGGDATFGNHGRGKCRYASRAP